MEEMIIQDFEFNKYSLDYGRFLMSVYETCPDIKFEDVAKFYDYKTNTVHISLAVPHSLAVVLKLTFGAYLRVRPDPSIKELEKEIFYNLANLSSYKKKRINNNDMYIVDYIDLGFENYIDYE